MPDACASIETNTTANIPSTLALDRFLSPVVPGPAVMSLDTRKVKGHRKESSAKSKQDLVDIKGSNHADALAGIAAQKHAQPINKQEHFIL